MFDEPVGSRPSNVRRHQRQKTEPFRRLLSSSRDIEFRSAKHHSTAVSTAPFSFISLHFVWSVRLNVKVSTIRQSNHAVDSGSLRSNPFSPSSTPASNS